MAEAICKFCGLKFPVSRDRCMHCARPSLFPNVKLAELEREVLRQRASKARQDASARGVAEAVAALEEAAKTTKAVVARPPTEVARLSYSDREIYATYYQLAEAGVRVPKGDKWDVLRQATDAALFSGFQEEIRFGVVSLDGLGALNYGRCFLVLREDMIAHRATVFESNVVLWLKQHAKSLDDLTDLPPGYRATWEQRSEIAVAFWPMTSP